MLSIHPLLHAYAHCQIISIDTIIEMKKKCRLSSLHIQRTREKKIKKAESWFRVFFSSSLRTFFFLLFAVLVKPLVSVCLISYQHHFQHIEYEIARLISFILEFSFFSFFLSLSRSWWSMSTVSKRRNSLQWSECLVDIQGFSFDWFLLVWRANRCFLYRIWYFIFLLLCRCFVLHDVERFPRWNNSTTQ